MKWIANIPQPAQLRFVIERQLFRDMITQQDVEGFYLYVYLGDVCIRDHLQDTYEIVLDQAFEDYNVPKDVWRRIEGQPMQWGAEGKYERVLRFSIERDKKNRFHVCIHEDERKLYDYPAKTLDTAKDHAHSMFHISQDVWKQVNE
jgi:hypothetical protein